MSEQIEIREDVARHRFEIWLNDEPAGLTAYEEDGTVLAFVHTEVAEEFGGRGLASTLIRSALDTVRERGGQVLPYCQFVKAFIQKHPDYADLVPADRRAAFDLATESA